MDSERGLFSDDEEKALKTRFLDRVIREAASAAADRGEGPISDADLLRRFVSHRDQTAFSVLVKRHARLVWAVCRQVTVDPSDAEDSFQAVWVVLLRKADSIRKATSLPSWLHGTAYRVSAKANRSAGRRRARETATAQPESDRPIANATWGSLLAAVHEEIARLPDALRTAFVLCDLEGVAPGAAAAQLGWKSGTLTGRLCQARQSLVNQLTRRGLAPATALAGCGVGTATSVATVPNEIMAAAATLPAATATIPFSILELAKAATEGTMTHMKLLAAGVLIAGALGLTTTASVLAQRPGQSSQQPPAGPLNRGAAAPAGANPFGQVPGNAVLDPAGRPGRSPNSALAGLWEYKVESMPGERNAFIALLTTRGNEGWEYCGIVSFANGAQAAFEGLNNFGNAANQNGGNPIAANDSLVGWLGQNRAGAASTNDLVFKRPKPAARTSSARTDAGFNPLGELTGGQRQAVGSDNGPFSGQPAGSDPLIGRASGFEEPAQNQFGSSGTPGSGNTGSPEVTLKIVTLKQVKAHEASQIATQLFDGQITIAVDASTNSLILKANAKTLDAVTALLSKLDQLERKAEASGYPDN